MKIVFVLAGIVIIGTILLALGGCMAYQSIKPDGSQTTFKTSMPFMSGSDQSQ